jgi:hypothetical protein
MRVLGFALIAGLAACASASVGIGGDPDLPPLPFPVQRGSALPPPASTGAHAAPPEGQGAGGLNFGQWRGADPAQYAAAFRAEVGARYSDVSRPDIRADLDRNGFACEDAQRLDCRIEIMERDCAYDWYVVVEPNRDAPIAGFDQMCLGARQGSSR